MEQYEFIYTKEGKIDLDKTAKKYQVSTRTIQKYIDSRKEKGDLLKIESKLEERIRNWN